MMKTSPSRSVSLGWQLAAVEIAPLETSLADSRCLKTVASAIGGAEAILLSCDAVSRLWDRAVGEGTRQFRSTSREHEAWQGLTQLLTALKRFRDRGGVLVCRLDLPSPACRVGRAADDPLFPRTATINCFDALAAVHPLLAEIAATNRPVTQSDGLLGEASHPAQTYLEEFAWCVAPAVAWEAKPEIGQTLATTPAGLAIAAAAERIVCLPRLARHDTAVEAVLLLELIDALRADSASDAASIQALISATDARPSAMSSAIPKTRRPAALAAPTVPADSIDDLPLATPKLDALRRHEDHLSQQIASLEQQRRALATRRELAEYFWNQPADAGAKPLAARLERLLGLLGYGDSAQGALWTCDDTTIVEARAEPPSVADRRAGDHRAGDHRAAGATEIEELHGFALGSLEIGPNQRLAVVWFDGPPPTTNAAPHLLSDVAFDAAIKAAENLSGVVVPLPELARAASALLLAGGDEEFARAIRRSLASAATTAPGVFRYSPGDTLLSAAERKLLQAAA